jgi:methionyl-tRNA synthetase
MPGQAMAFSITTPIYYVNSDPHLGHAYTTVAADVLARHHRARGEPVFFLTGTDEHGGKVADAAAQAGLPPKEFCDIVAARFRALGDALESTHDYFIRTTDPEHEVRVQAFVQRLYDAGELYEGTYAGLYCSGCEQFYQESDLIQPGNLCPLHGTPAQWVEEKNWFFPLTKWVPRLLELYDRDPEFVRPRARYNEARSLIEAGLEDVSFTRATVTWGVPVPWEPDQTVYVWVDALLNYRTGLEYGLGRDVSDVFWPISLHLMAKDILRLHSIVWPAMLMAAGYEPPRKLFVHGYFTSGGQKMSKSLGNVIDPFEVIDELGADALRFYLLREVQWGQDGDVTVEGLRRRYEGELANDLGNLVSRTTAMIVRYRDGVVPAGHNALTSVHERVGELLEQVDLTGTLAEIWTLVRAANRFVEERRPWELARDDSADAARRLDDTLYTLADSVRSLAVLLHPFIPASAAGMLEAVGDAGAVSWDRAGLGLLEQGAAVHQPPPLFPRLTPA